MDFQQTPVSVCMLLDHTLLVSAQLAVVPRTAGQKMRPLRLQLVLYGLQFVLKVKLFCHKAMSLGHLTGAQIIYISLIGFIYPSFDV